MNQKWASVEIHKLMLEIKLTGNVNPNTILVLHTIKEKNEFSFIEKLRSWY